MLFKKFRVWECILYPAGESSRGEVRFLFCSSCANCEHKMFWNNVFSTVSFLVRMYNKDSSLKKYLGVSLCHEMCKSLDIKMNDGTTQLNCVYHKSQD